MTFELMFAGLVALSAPSTMPDPVPDSAARTIAQADAVGQRLELEDVNFENIPKLPLNIEPAGGPQFLLSDKPEYFRTGDGIAMSERVEPGDVRLYLYHVPTPDAGPKKITAVIENLGEEAMHVKFERAIVPTPGGDYQKIGKTGLVGLFSEGGDLSNMNLTVPAGETVLLDESLLQYDLVTNDLIHAIYEFSVDQPAQISTLQTAPGVDPTKAVNTLEKLPPVLPGHHPSGAGRGLFETSAIDLTTEGTWDTADGAAQVIFADGDDHWIEGRDSISGEPSLNKGNYGVIYRMRIPYRSSDGRGVSLLVYNPRAGAKWCGVQAVAVKLLSEGQLDAGETGIAELPGDAVRYAGPPEAVLVQHYPPAGEGEEGVIELLFSPPGASCLPVPFVLVPTPAANGATEEG